jgi:hypothetical protein
MERWKPIPVAPAYSISNLGNVKRDIPPKKNRTYPPPKQHLLGRGYAYIRLQTESGGKTFQVHRLVMLAFVGPSDLQVNHKNGIKHDNRLANLEYVTNAENRRHAMYELRAFPKGVRHPNAKLTDQDVWRIKGMHALGFDCLTISKVFSCTQQNINVIVKGKAWAHVDGPTLIP